jgi:PhnB protein
MQVTPYLFYNGRCEEAIAFYVAATDGELLFKMTYGDMPDETPVEDEGCPSGMSYTPEQIMHAHVRIGQGEIMMSDGGQPQNYAGFAVSLSTPDEAQGKRWFDALSAGGEITKSWEPTFWANGFGMFTDKFGVPWMVNAYKPQI